MHKLSSIIRLTARHRRGRITSTLAPFRPHWPCASGPQVWKLNRSGTNAVANSPVLQESSTNVPHIDMCQERSAQRQAIGGNPFTFYSGTVGSRSRCTQTGLNRTQQFASCTAGSIAMRVRFRAMAIDLIRLASQDAEKFSKVRHKVASDFRRHSESIEDRGQVLRRRSLLVTANLPCRPVQQTQIFSNRHRQKTFVAAMLALCMSAWPLFANPQLDVSSAQINRRQMPCVP